MLYVDQCGRAKQNSNDIITNWLDVYFNLTKVMTGFFLSDQFWNIELNCKSYSLKYQYLCFYVDFLYIDGYALGFKTEIMINSEFWTWQLILDGLKYTL